MDIGNFKKGKGDDQDAWLDWLDETGDDMPVNPKPVPMAKPHATKSPDGFMPPQVKKPKKVIRNIEPPPKSPVVTIKLHMPAVRLPRPHIPWRVVRWWGVAIVLVFGALLGGKQLQAMLAKPKRAPIQAPVVAQAELGYRPLVPEVRATTEPAPTKPIFDAERKLFSFNDVYKGARLTVDQQEVPAKLKDNQAEIDKLAKSLSATETFTTSLGEVHLFTDVRSGSQRLFVVNDKMLMFIQSTQKVSVEDWVTYIQALQ